MSSVFLPDFRHPFGGNMNILSEYDGIFLSALDEDTNVLYVYENSPQDPVF